jgi:tetratricopeptide (TPR) repeat protein
MLRNWAAVAGLPSEVAMPRFPSLSCRALGSLLTLLGFAAVAPAGERYALLVGVRSYSKTKELRPLPYAEADVTDLAAVLREVGYRPENVVLMTQKAVAEDPRFLPSKEQIREELRLLLQGRAAGDTVLVAFAGHGVQFRDDPVNYFCPTDGRLDDKQTLLSLQDVSAELERCPAGVKVLLVDACRNDPLTETARAAGRVPLESVTRPPVPRPASGVAAFFSCQASEKALEDPELKHGVFFNFVIEGLRGEAANASGDVTLLGLADFVTTRTKDFVRANHRGSQQPSLQANDQGGVVLASGVGAVRALRRGQELLTRYDYDGATEQFTAALRLSPGSAAAYRGRGEAFEGLNQYDRAVEDFTAALRINPSDAEGQAARGMAYFNLYDKDRCRADLEAALRNLRPTDAATYSLRAQIHNVLSACGETAGSDRAIADASEAIRLDPNYARAYIRRAGAYAARNEPDRVISDASEAIRLKPNYAGAYYTRATTYLFSKGEFGQAIRDLDHAVRVDPNYADAFALRGWAYHETKNYDRAIRDCDQALRLDPKSVEAYVHRGVVYTDQGDSDQGLRDLTKAIRLDPRSAKAYANRAYIYLQREEYVRAVEDCNVAVVLDPEFALGYANRGVAYRNLGRNEWAAADKAKARKLGYKGE